MVIVFDLDDTLYAERTYVDSGFRAVARFGARRFGWDEDASFRFMSDVLDREGRGSIFDKWLAAFGERGRGSVRECVRVYRHHRPQIRLYDEAAHLLPRLSRNPLYVLTDGHKVVQEHKARALRLDKYFRHVYITHRHGLRHAKPSTYCFERLRARERCEWIDMIYVGDNPTKDFVNLNALCVRTVRVLTGMYRNAQALPGHDARFTISSLREFEVLLRSL